MRKYLFLFLVMVPLASFAQTSKVIPPSPEASSIFKFTEIPVSLYAGTADISIPLYRIQVGDLSIPITLTYHSRGMQVGEIASHVGMGWSLNYGGIISRQIRGLSDDAVRGYLHQDFYNEVFTNANINSNVYNSYVNHNIDLIPDQFFYSVNNNSGKFIFDQTDKSILLQHYSDMKIKEIWKEGRIKGWIITDQTGNKYYFGLSKDGQRSANDCDWNIYNYSLAFAEGGIKDLGLNQDRFINTWHLMEIETPDHEFIQFYYQLENPVFYRRKFDKKDNDLIAVSYFSKIYEKQYQISKIVFSNGQIKFTPQVTDRKDLPASHAVEKVEIFDKSNVLFKRYKFSYSYPLTVDDDNQLSYLKTADASSNYRLFLHSIEEQDKTGQSKAPYLFEYNTTAIPNRFSNSQDRWGYYNGKPNGPYLTFFNYGTYNIDRGVDTDRSKAGLLTKVTYPTGGSVSFIYEQNRGILPGSLNALLYPHTSERKVIPVLDGFLKNMQEYHEDELSGYFIHKVAIDPLSPYPVEFNMGLPWRNEENRDNNALFGYRVYISSDSTGYSTLVYNLQSEINNLDLPSGNYTVKVVPPAGYDINDYRNTFYITLQWKEERYDSSLIQGNDTLVYAPGNRIRSIKYYNGDGRLVSDKEYEYKNPATGHSSGVIFSAGNMGYTIRPVQISSANYYPAYIATSAFPLHGFNGNGIGYSHVTEYYGNMQSNRGKTEYDFTITGNAGHYNEFPFPLPVDNEWLRGKPLDIRTYAYSADGYTLKKEVENQYSYGGYPGIEGIYLTPLLHAGDKYTYEKDSTHFYLPLIVFDKDTLALYNYDVYYQMGGTMDLYSTTIIEYPDVGVPISHQTFYGYHYAKHYQIEQKNTTTSRGKQATTRLYYPPDIDNPSDAVQALIAAHRVAVPLKLETLLKSGASGMELSRTTHITQYKDWGNGIIAPEVLKTSYNSGPFDTTNRFFAYDIHGNPAEAAGKEGIHTVYLWGYSSQYPVAKVIGSDYTTVKSCINQTILDSASKYTDAQLQTELNKIRTDLAGTNAQVWTYTYSPLIGRTSETDPRGNTRYYEYDGFGHLTLIRDGERKIIKQYAYHYFTPPTIYYSEEKSASFICQCSNGYDGSSVIYTVPAGAYSSAISQDDANQKAQDDIDANGQTYANTHGTCTLTIYVTLTTSQGAPIFESGCLNTYSDITLHFYKDAAHVIPYSVSNLEVEVEETTTHYINGQAGTPGYSYTTYTCNGNSYTLSSQLTYHACTSGNCFPNICLPGPNDPYTTYSFSLVNATFTFTQ